MTDSKKSVDFSLVLASSVHDMKNSIGMLIASLEAALEDQPPEKRKENKHFNTLHYEASRINSELVQLLSIYRMEHNHLPLRIDQHYVIDVLEEQIARNHALIESKDIEMILACPDDLEWVFDADLVGSVVQNVLVNCSRYTKHKLLLSAGIKDDVLCLTVADDGGGYPKAMLEASSKIIEEVDVTAGNTHLGMYFAEQIAALHKQKNRVGYITLKNGEPLGGGVFQMFLP